MSVINNGATTTNENISGNYERKIGQMLLDLLNERQLMDVRICCDGHTFLGNKLMLAASSEFFYYVFGNANRLTINRVFLPDVDPAIITPILMYIHNGAWGNTPLSDKKSEALNETLKAFGMLDVKLHRLNIMADNLTPQTFLRIWNLASSLKYTEVENKIASFVVNNLELCSETGQFCELKLNQIMSVLSRDEVDLIDPFKTGFAIFKWVAYDTILRKKFLSSLILVLKVPFLIRKIIEKYVTEQLKNICPLCYNTTDPIGSKVSLNDFHIVGKSSMADIMSFYPIHKSSSLTSERYKTNREHLEMLLANMRKSKNNILAKKMKTGSNPFVVFCSDDERNKHCRQEMYPYKSSHVDSALQDDSDNSRTKLETKKTCGKVKSHPVSIFVSSFSPLHWKKKKKMYQKPKAIKDISLSDCSDDECNE